MFKPTVQKGQLNASTATLEFDLTFGEGYPSNIFVVYDTNTLSGSETLDFNGKFVGNDNYSDDVLVTQIALSSDDVKTQELDPSSLGPLSKIKLTGGGLASAETVDIAVVTW